MKLIMLMKANRTKKLCQSGFSVILILLISAYLSACESSSGSTKLYEPSLVGTDTANAGNLSSNTSSSNIESSNIVSSGAIWPSYNAPTYFGHGYASEDSDRSSAIAATRSAGLDCIRTDGTNPPSDELAMHLLLFRSPVDGHFLSQDENWWWRAHRGGVNRYVIDLGDGSSLSRWRFLIKDYPANTVQFIVNGLVVPQ